MKVNLPTNIAATKEALKEGELTVVELVDSYLARIREFDKKINSLITITDDLAYKQARKADNLIKDNPEAFSQFPLLGVVLAHKDIYSTKGVRTTAGSRVLESYVPSYSATIVKKLEAAGAIMLGKTNLDAWAHGSSGENSDFGPTKNPWNEQRVPGGSSSGSAAATAAGFCLAATGTDTGGSIRLPASFCNLVGFKPTYGAVSRYGVVAMASSLDSMGHFTRTVEDSRKIFNITRGLDDFDSSLGQKKQKDKKKRSFKVGIPKEYFEKGLDREVEVKVLQAIEVLRQEGIDFVDISLPHTKYGISVYYIIQPAEVSSNLARYDGVRFGQDRTAFSQEAKRRIMLGTYVLSAGYKDAYYLRASRVRSKIIADFDAAFNQVDALLTPVSPTPAFKLGEKISDPLQMYLADLLTVSANLAGIPAISIPAGFTKEKLPVSFQLMSARFNEDVIFTLGEKYQAKTDWHLKSPQLV